MGRRRPHLRRDVQGAYLARLVGSMSAGDILIGEYLDRADNALKPMLRAALAIARMAQPPLGKPFGFYMWFVD